MTTSESQEELRDESIGAIIVRKIQSCGAAKTRLQKVLGNPLFENLSKHNPQWESKHDREDELLYGIRVGLVSLEEELWAVIEELS